MVHSINPNENKQVHKIYFVIKLKHSLTYHLFLNATLIMSIMNCNVGTAQESGM